MKLKLIFLVLLGLVWSETLHANDNGLAKINKKGYVTCGTNLGSKSMAYTDESGYWRGIDADICRNFALAIFANEEAIKMQNVDSDKVSQALISGNIDIMLGNSTLSAKQEVTSEAAAIDVIYYDKQIFAMRGETEATSMEDFRGSKVCVLDKSSDYANVNAYNHKYGMEFKLLTFPNTDAAKQAFYLKRCQLITGSEFFLKGLAETMITQDKRLTVLPEVIAYRPIYAYSAKNNPKLRIIGKWIINAPKLAEQQGISSKNAEAFASVKDESIQNLLGFNQQLWIDFGLNPDWVRKALEQRGNFGEMYDKNIGEDSAINIKRDKNNLIENGGLIIASPFV